ncbi:MAG: hypothetical protein HYU66_21935 [Armatimonadetes bacterium]|nr:hypothetical protein [Armatimonadota bacterium]
MKKLLGPPIVILLVAGVVGIIVMRTRGGPISEGDIAAPAPNLPPPPTGPVPRMRSFVPLKLHLVVAAGWEEGKVPDETHIIPDGGPTLVLTKSGAGKLPLFVVGIVPAETLGKSNPQEYPAAFVTTLKEQLAKTHPAPKILPDPTPPQTSLFKTSASLLAEGAFAEMGVAQGRARFMAGATEGGEVYVVAAFSSDEQTEKDINEMIGSMGAAKLPGVLGKPAGEAGAPGPGAETPATP